MLIVLEDAHWIDATTLEMMTRLIDSIGQARIACGGDRTAGFRAALAGAAAGDAGDARPSGRQDCAQLVAGVAAAHGLSAEAVAAIVAKTDGIPLFVEELTKSVMESAGEDGAVPATLKDSLMARLDRLGDARDVAQIAAVIGRQFSLALLERRDGAGCGRTRHDAGAARRRGNRFSPEERGLERSFIFKHALVRDVAYESLLSARRREWHERIARALEKTSAISPRANRTCSPIISARPGCWFPPATIGCGPAIRP